MGGKQGGLVGGGGGREAGWLGGGEGFRCQSTERLPLKKYEIS